MFSFVIILGQKPHTMFTFFEGLIKFSISLLSYSALAENLNFLLLIYDSPLKTLIHKQICVNIHKNVSFHIYKLYSALLNYIPGDGVFFLFFFFFYYQHQPRQCQFTTPNESFFFYFILFVGKKEKRL